MIKFIVVCGFCFLFSINISFAQKTISHDFKDFKSTISLKGEKQKTDVLMNPGLMVLHDSLLFFRDYNCNPNYKVLNVNTGRIINSFGIKGRGPGEIIAPFGIQIIENDDMVLINDITGRKIVKFSITKILNKDPNPFIGKIKVNDPYSRALWVKDGLICTIKRDKDYYSHGIVEHFSGQIIRKFGHFPKLEVGYSQDMASNLFQRPLGTYLNKHNIFAEAYCSFNRIDLFKNERLYAIISGNENKKLKYELQSNGPILTDENNYCFIQVDSHNDRLYASYSGNSRRGKDVRKVINKVLVFDIEGTPIELFNLDPPVNYLAFDFENKTIWGINKVLEPTLYKFQY